MAESIGVIRERDDIIFYGMLNKGKVGVVDDAVEPLLKSRFAVQNEILYSSDSLYFFAENAPADVYKINF